MRDVRIEPKEGKGRTFFATLLASAEADTLWEGGQTDTDDERPIFAMFSASDAEMRPFHANLVLGHKVLYGGETHGFRSASRSDKLVLLKTAGYEYTWQRETEGAILTARMADLFRFDPGMVDPKGATFVLMPDKRYLASQKIDGVKEIVEHSVKLGFPVSAADLEALVPMAFLFCATLDRRTRAPLYHDGRFYLQVMLACLSKGLASWPSEPHRSWHDREFGVHQSLRFHVYNTDRVGLARGLVFKAEHARIEELLSEEVDRFFLATR